MAHLLMLGSRERARQTLYPKTFPERHATDDSILVMRICYGNAEAMGQLFNRHATSVYSVALRILLVSGPAEDVLQKVFMQVWREPASFRDLGESLASSLVLLARDRAVEALLDRRDLDQSETTPAAFCPLDSKTAEARSSLNLDLGQRISSYSENALEMAFFEGKTVDIIAAQLGKTTTAIKMEIGTAVKQLRG